MKVLKKNNGFTLVELIVVIAIVGILAAVLIPSLSGYVSKAKDSAALQEAETIKTAYLTWQIERVDFAVQDDDSKPDLKHDFSDYLESLNLLSGDQLVTTREGETNYEKGFLFTASNRRVIEAVYDTTTQKLTMTLKTTD